MDGTLRERLVPLSSNIEKNHGKGFSFHSIESPNNIDVVVVVGKMIFWLAHPSVIEVWGILRRKISCGSKLTKPMVH